MKKKERALYPNSSLLCGVSVHTPRPPHNKKINHFLLWSCKAHGMPLYRKDRIIIAENENLAYASMFQYTFGVMHMHT